MAPDRYEVTVIGEEPCRVTCVLCCLRFVSGEKPLKTLCCIQFRELWYDDKGIKFYLLGDKAEIDHVRVKVMVYTEKARIFQRVRTFDSAAGSALFIPHQFTSCKLTRDLRC